MKVEVVKIKKVQFEPIQIDVECEEKTVKDGNGNILFTIPRFITHAHANGSDIKFDWFMDRLYATWRRVLWD